MQTEEVAKQAKVYYPALLEQEKSLLQQRKEALKNLENQKSILEANQKELKNVERLYKDIDSTLKLINATDLTDAEKIDAFNSRMQELGHSIKADQLNMEAFTNQYAHLFQEVEKNGRIFIENKDALAGIDKQLEKTRGEIANAEIGMTKFQKVLAKTGIVGKTAVTMLKTALASIGIGLLISLLVKAGEELMKMVRKANELKKINDDIAKSTNQIGAKSVVVLKELSYAYQKLGDNAKAKQKFIEEYNDKIKETGIEINDVKKAEDVLINNTDSYVKAIMKRAEAQAIESKAIDLYKEYLDERYELEQKLIANNKKIENSNAAGALPYTYSYNNTNTLQQASDKIAQQIWELDQKMNERLEKMFKDVANLQKSYSGFFASATTTVTNNKDDDKWKEWLAQKEKDLETLRQANEAAKEVFMDDIDKELRAVTKKYDELIALAKKYGEDSALLEVARQKEIDDIMAKYADKELEEQKQRIEEQYELLQTAIERIRKMNDTANLRDPRQQVFQTVYKGNGVMPFGIQKN